VDKEAAVEMVASDRRDVSVGVDGARGAGGRARGVRQGTGAENGREEHDFKHFYNEKKYKFKVEIVLQLVLPWSDSVGLSVGLAVYMQI
jgi:hypothetical protein